MPNKITALRRPGARRAACRRHGTLHACGGSPPASALLAAAVAVWLAVFFGGAYVLVWLIQTFEGDISECGSGECGRFGEFLDDHDLLALPALALVAALAAVLALRQARSLLARRA